MSCSLRREEIKVSLKKRGTEVLQDLPEKMKEAARLKMLKDLRQANSSYKRALVEKELRTAMALSDAHGLRSCLKRAESCEGLDELVEKAEGALHELSHMDGAKRMIQNANSVSELEKNLEQLIKENFPEGLADSSSLRRVTLELQRMKEKVGELESLLAKPLAFESNTTLLQEAGMRQMRLVLDALRLHPSIALCIDYGQAHIAGERAKAVQELLKKGCRNPVVKKQMKERSKQVRLHCEMEKCTPELKAALSKMLMRRVSCLSFFTFPQVYLYICTSIYIWMCIRCHILYGFTSGVSKSIAPPQPRCA